MLDQLPDKPLTVLKRQTHDTLRMRSEIQRLATVGRNLHQAVEGGRFEDAFFGGGLAVDDGRGEFAGMPEAGTDQGVSRC